MIEKVNEKYIFRLLIIAAIIFSIFSFITFYQNNQLNLAYGDAVSRLNITRKIIDNLNPGLGQIGSVWLPLPFILMLPFIGNEYLWHSGIAGYIVSGLSFIFTILYLYKFGILAFNNKLSAIIMSLFGLTSINYLYVQTTAMSESLFILTVIGATYHLYKWAKTKQESNLFTGALYISACTFIRYEGYFVFLMALIAVGLSTYIKTKSKRELEGNLIIFGTLAVTGIIAWTLYNWAIFGNPFYWVDIYTGKSSIISSEVIQVQVPAPATVDTSNKISIFKAIYLYWSSIAQTNGIYITVMSTIAAIVFTLIKLFNKKLFNRPENLFLYLPMGVFVFTAFAVYGGFPLELPALSISNLMNKETSYQGEYNLRYGLNMLPFVAIFIGWMVSLRVYFKVLAIAVLLIQIVTTFWFPVYSVYQIPQNFLGKSSSHHKGINVASQWLKNNYNGGLIMISAQNHNPDMFFLGYDYKNYIHEGAGKYWLESRENPQRYATWIYMYNAQKSKDDSVTKYISANPNTALFYDLVYQDGTYEIYKIKTHPEIEVKQ